jgi:undecaprenyl-diphosphatase
MTRGFNRSFAVRFSLLLSIPAVVGAGLVELVSAFRIGINVSMIPAYLIGMIFAAVVGYFSVQLLRRLATQKGKFGKIAYYCWGVGVLTILLSIVL